MAKTRAGRNGVLVLVSVPSRDEIVGAPKAEVVRCVTSSPARSGVRSGHGLRR